MENENLEQENVVEEPKKKKSKLPLIIIIVLIIVAAAVAATFLIISNNKDDGFKAPKTNQTPKPQVDLTEESEEDTEPTLDPNEDVSIKISSKDIKTCSLIKNVVNKALFQYKTYEETAALMKDGYVIIEIKEGGKSNAGKEFNALMAKALSTLQAPITEERDCYYVMIKEAVQSASGLSSEIYVVPGISGIKPSEKEFLQAAKDMATGNEPADTTDDKTPTLDPNAESSEIVDILNDTKENATKDDSTSCNSIESVVNAALSDENIYKETAKLIAQNGSVIIAACSKPKLAVAGCGPFMKTELLKSLKDLTGPTETGKDVYYICINGSVKGSAVTIGDVKVMTGSKKVKPTAKDFK